MGRGIGIGLGLNRGGKAGVSVPTILLSNSSIAENAANGTTIGTLSVINGSGTYTFTETADPDTKFGVTGTNLNKTAAMDYETATSHSVTIHADNGAGSTLDRTFTITVTNINEVPVVANALVDQSATEASAFSYQFASNSFTDPDAGTTLTYSASLSPSGSLPAWLSFNSSTRTFSGTPTSGDVGTVTIRVTASDGSLTVTDDFTITTAALSVGAVTWNPADKETNITLSNGNLTATHVGSGSFSVVRGTSSRSTGKYMVEYELVTGGWDGALVGLGSATASLTQFVGQNNQSLGLIDTGNAALYTNNAQLLNLATAVNMANGSRVALAIDFDADKIWVQVEGSGWIGAGATSGDPAAGTNGIDISGFLGAVSGPVFPMMNGFYSGDSVTLVPSGFQHTIPSGFLAWDDAGTIAAPTLTWLTGGSDNTPTIRAAFTGLLVGDVVGFEVDDNSGFTSVDSTPSDTLDAGEITAGQIDVVLSTLTDGTWYVRARINRSGSFSSYSNTVSQTIASGLWDPSQLGSSVFVAGYRLLDTNGANAGAEYNSGTGTWSDWSGNSHNATQATSGNRATYGATALDGTRPGLTFDGDDFLTAALTEAAAGGRPAIFAVIKPTTIKFAGGIAVWRGTGAAATGLDFVGTTRFGYMWNDDAATWGYNGAPLVTLNAVYICGLHAPDATAAIIGINGTDYTNTANVHATLTNNTVDLALFRDPESGGNREFIGVASEVVIVDGAALTTANRRKIEGYLAWKYGIQGSLPSGHTYASAAPTV